MVYRLELKKSKKGNQMLSIWFKILKGEYKGYMIFYNQIISLGFGMHSANDMLRSLNSGALINFINFKEYNQTILDVFKAIENNLQYEIKYSKNNKDFNTYKILSVKELDLDVIL